MKEVKRKIAKIIGGKSNSESDSCSGKKFRIGVFEINVPEELRRK